MASCWCDRPPRTGVSPRLRAWLTVPDSLTRRLQAAGTTFRVRLVGGGKAPALAGGWSGRRVPVREVLLEVDGKPVIFARSELSTVKGSRLARWLAGLGARSLGSLLFTHPGFVRAPLEYRRLDARHPLWRRAARVVPLNGPVWARRSRHVFGGQSVLVTELYLSGIKALPIAGNRGARM